MPARCNAPTYFDASIMIGTPGGRLINWSASAPSIAMRPTEFTIASFKTSGTACVIRTRFKTARAIASGCMNRTTRGCAGLSL